MHANTGLEVTISEAPIADALTLRDIYFHIQPNHVTCLLGPSGCGKSSILRLIAGLRQSPNCQIALNGTALEHTPAHARQIGLLFQHPSLFPHLTVEANVGFGIAQGQDSDALIHKWLSRVGMEHRKAAYPHELSGGQQQRIAFARTMAAQPKALLLDEPFASLDYALKTQMRDQLWEWVQGEELPILLVTHDPMEAMQLADDVVVLEDGQMRQQGTVESLYAKPNTMFVAGLFGEMNRDGTRLIRPEHITLSPKEKKDMQEATVLRYRRMGEHYRLLLEAEGTRWIAYDHENLSCETGSKLYFKPEDDKWIEIAA